MNFELRLELPTLEEDLGRTTRTMELSIGEMVHIEASFPKSLGSPHLM